MGGRNVGIIKKHRLGLLILILFLLVFSLSVLYRFQRDFSIDNDQIQVGYETNNETQTIINPQDHIKWGKIVVISVHYANMVEKSSNVPSKLILVSRKTNKTVFQDVREEYVGFSGFEIKLDTSSLDRGKYIIKLFRNNKLVTTKSIEVI